MPKTRQPTQSRPEPSAKIRSRASKQGQGTTTAAAGRRKTPTRADLERAVAQLQATVADLHQQNQRLREKHRVPENPVDIPVQEPAPELGTKIDVSTLPVRSREQPHGGTLKEGGTRGPGRPKNIFREMLQEELEERLQFFLDVIDGKDFIQPGIFGPILAPAPLAIRVKAWGELAKYAIGAAAPSDSGETRQLTLVWRRE